MKLRFGLMAVALLGCGDKEEDTNSLTESGEDTNMEGGVCGEDGLCDLTVTDATAECGQGTPGDPAALTAESPSSGVVALTLVNAEQGCCPTIGASGMASLRNDTLSAEYWLTSDDCDCVCSLDVALVFAEVPAGSFTVTLGGETATVTVE